MQLLSRAVSTLFLAIAVLPGCSSDDAPKQTASAGCHADSECGEGHCDPKNGCVACLFDAHCKEGERCAAGSCYEPTSCAADTDCSGKDFPVCDPSAHQCVRCLSDDQCGDSAHCRDGGCQPFAKCAAEKDCTGGTHCDLGSGECVTCLTKGDCQLGSDCVQGECRVACKAEADCSANGQHCAASGHCGECGDDTHCPDVYHCQAGSCVRDVCEQNTARCSEDGSSVTNCSMNGDAQLVSACATGQSCAEKDGLAACQPWQCAPSSDRCSADGSAVEHCAADGLSVEKSEPCADKERCVAGHCATITCEPNSAFCRDGASYTCSFDGTESTLTKACADGELCDTGSGKCISKRCTAGTTTCQQHSLGTCRDDGSGFDYEPCKVDELCSDGACKKAVCAPNSSYCEGSNAMRCNANGTSATVDDDCSPNECITSGNYAYCQAQDCTPGEAVCDGTKATFCKEDGSGPEPGGVDCPSISGYCEAGQCKPNVCVPNQRTCQGEYMYTCSADGKTLSSYSYYACNSYYWSYSHCNPATGQCQQQTCTPNQAYCSNNVAYKCDATGYAGISQEDCTASGKICTNGTCQAKVCDAGTYFCKDGNVNYCSDGVSSSISNTCTANYYCKPGYYYCLADVCTAGKPVCNGNAVSTCAADGSGPADAGTACGANKVCVSGACAPVTCTANALFCQGGHVQKCDANGTSATLYQYCVSETYCDSGTSTCKADVCPSGKAYCDAEALKTCKADGSGSVDAGTNCGASNKVCTPTGCVATALEPIGTTGSTYYSGSDTMYGDIIKVSQTRKLTKIEADLTISSGPVSAHWLVYSSTDGVNFYQASDTSASIPTTADAWVGSSALAVTLEAGIYYWIGLELTPTGGASAVYHSDSSLSTPTLSFAQVLGSAYRNSAGPPASFTPSKSTSLYYVRLSTTLP
ncbi:MAG TPA: hypothetical protein VHB79_16820 [Polyangiaceae bacterium]|nr:hypothetical protein [Polyangiaceae bacterium]